MLSTSLQYYFVLIMVLVTSYILENENLRSNRLYNNPYKYTIINVYCNNYSIHQ